MPSSITLQSAIRIALALMLMQIAVLFWFGQPAICECGFVKLWEGNVGSEGNSQHLSDWYTPSHIIHGILFFFLLGWLFPRLTLGYRFLIALAIEVGWEILENTPMVIEHYRQQALAAGYVGDSILNSVSDTVAMIIGFVLAIRMPLWLAIIIIVALEAITMYVIRDGLALNIINLLYPFEFIAEWQTP